MPPIIGSMEPQDTIHKFGNAPVMYRHCWHMHGNERRCDRMLSGRSSTDKLSLSAPHYQESIHGLGDLPVLYLHRQHLQDMQDIEGRCDRIRPLERAGSDGHQPTAVLECPPPIIGSAGDDTCNMYIDVTGVLYYATTASIWILVAHA